MSTTIVKYNKLLHLFPQPLVRKMFDDDGWLLLEHSEGGYILVAPSLGSLSQSYGLSLEQIRDMITHISEYGEFLKSASEQKL